MNIVYPAIVVAYPPSTNRLWSYSKKGVYRTKSYMDWLDEALYAIKWQHETIELLCGVSIWANPGDKRKRDIDNIVKPLLDLLEHAKIVKNDNQFIELGVRWDYQIPPRKVSILITGLVHDAMEHQPSTEMIAS